jgi:hypothetical protein
MSDRLVIAYETLLLETGLLEKEAVAPAFARALEKAWLRVYRSRSKHEPTVAEFEDDGFTFLYDQASASITEVDDRLIAAFGNSRAQDRKRDASRLRGFLGGRLNIPGKGVFDKGHALAHSMGGGLDANLFPQNPDLNRGRSAEGRRFRRMERFAAKHPGTFTFLHLLYRDESWVPCALEYGLLEPDGNLQVERFDNVPSEA